MRRPPPHKWQLKVFLTSCSACVAVVTVGVVLFPELSQVLHLSATAANLLINVIWIWEEV